MTFAEQLYDYLQRIQPPYWTLWEARLCRVLESMKPEALAYAQSLEQRYGTSEVAVAWPMINQLLPFELPPIVEKLNWYQ
jgi:hypothetical protein